jgi:TM2 domain-containing membrane protein YozV
MRKKLSVITVVLLLAIQTSNSAVPYANPLSRPSNEMTIDIGYGVRLSPYRLMTLTPKEYRELTGHRLGFFKGMALKATQKKMAKQLANGSGGGGDKSQITAILLCFFLGGLGIHRFYLGYTWQGVVQLLTLGGLGIWALIDFIRIIIGDLKPKNGEYTKK